MHIIGYPVFINIRKICHHSQHYIDTIIKLEINKYLQDKLSEGNMFIFANTIITFMGITVTLKSE
jgi:hypothetical protein